jgi:hypothetical protein
MKNVKKKIWSCEKISIMTALNIGWGETPNEAFIRKLHQELMIRLFFKTFGW